MERAVLVCYSNDFYKSKNSLSNLRSSVLNLTQNTPVITFLCARSISRNLKLIAMLDVV
jgi:hypothetical protein